MAYTKQPWVDNVTPVDASRMLHLEDGIEMQVDVDSVVAAAGQLVATKLLAADAQPAFKILGNGTIGWGAGGTTAQETSLSRSAAYTLRVSEILEVGQQLSIGVNNNAFLSLKNDANGIYFGAASDANLYRASMGLLVSDTDIEPRYGSAYRVRVGFVAGPNAAGLQFGTSYDTTLYRVSAGLLRTDGYLDAMAGMIAANSTSKHVEIGIDRMGGGQAQINFGPTQDTNLYRAAANMLMTNSLFIAQKSIYSQPSDTNGGFVFNPGAVGGNALLVAVQGEANPRFYINVNGNLSWGPGGAGASDTTMYRQAVGVLTTDQIFTSAKEIYARQNYATQIYLGDYAGFAGMAFGPAMDTVLYRASAGKLKSPNVLEIGDPAQTGYGLFSLNQQGINLPNIGGDGYLILGYKRAADTQNRLTIFDGGSGGEPGGRIVWGPGGTTATDTNLYRAAANVLKTDGYFVSLNGIEAWGATAAGEGFVAKVVGDSSVRWSANANGDLWWGPGNAAQDTSMSRAAAGYLKANQNFLVGNSLYVNHNNATVGTGIYFGSAGDTNLYRNAANTLKTDSSLVVAGGPTTLGITGLTVNVGSIGVRQIKCGAVDSGGGGSRMLVIDN